ncbi:beta-ketoacyl synthase N-terminal-like domain-containing protein [Lysinibacillus sphaericus]|uniref:beta-ketoacyl synthase N-terminal-like domain-containing protein n=1 Tax=Lysinibacillus sphaericus TaxID=1421 RepID=UPI003CFCEFC0
MKYNTLSKKILSLVEENKLDTHLALNILDEIEKDTSEPLAIVGMSLRFPEVSNLDDLWSGLVNKKDFVTEFSKERFDLIVNSNPKLHELYSHLKNKITNDPRSYGSWLHNIEQFDPEKFGLNEHEAQFMGPAERLFLQVALESLYMAGYQENHLKDSNTGVFIAHTPHPAFDYLNLFEERDERAFISNIPANLGYHLSYALDLKGPVMTINTSCSSSLAAVHVAKNALKQGDCNLAVVAGVNLNLFPYWEEEAPDYVVRSTKYRCSPFDKSGDGIIGGEGVAAIVIKRLSDAINDNNHIHAVLKGSSISSDGASNGMQVPNPDAQSKAIMDALDEAKLSFNEIDFVEAHGAGTQVGDLIEVEGLKKAYLEKSNKTSECQLGSIKSNFGHMGDAAGIAGLMKAVLSIEKREVPGLNHFEVENPKIGFKDSPFKVSSENKKYDGNRILRAGVNSIGISGTNVHVVLEGYQSNKTEQFSSTLTPLFISSKTRRALWDQIKLLAIHLKNNQNYSIQDLAYTLNNRRSHERSRMCIFASNCNELHQKIERLLNVRTFEKVPKNFYTQGIFLADEHETQVESIKNLDEFNVSTTYKDLMQQYLEGNNVENECRELFKDGKLLPLPVSIFNTRRIWPSSKDAFLNQTKELFFEKKWINYPYNNTNTHEELKAGSTWIFFMNKDDEDMVELKNKMAHIGIRVIEVHKSETFVKHTDEQYSIDINSDTDMYKLFENIGLHELKNLKGIIHSYTFKHLDETMESKENMEKSQEEGIFSLFNITKMLLEFDVTHPIQLNVMSSLTEQIKDNEKIIPARVTIFGLAKVISQEQPTISSYSIDHDLDGGSQEIATHLFKELQQDKDTRPELVAFRKSERYTKVIERQSDNFNGNELLVRENGNYVIAGGTGYLGVQLGKFLSEKETVNIILLARNLLPDRIEWTKIIENNQAEDEMLIYKLTLIMEIESRGSTVTIMQCDVTEEHSVKETFAKIRQDFGEINGAFMLVKQLYHLWIKELKLSQFKKGIHNRVIGTYLVEKELNPEPLDFFILFSSISSLMGTKSASECCAVNQYLDSMAGYLNQKGINGKTMNFTLILDDKKDFGSDTAIPPIDFMDFQNSLNLFFNKGYEWSLISRFDLEQVHYLKPVIKIPFGESFWSEVECFNHSKDDQDESIPMEDEAVKSEFTLSEIEAGIREIWRTVLGVTTIKENDNFFSLGGSSLSALRFVHLFKNKFVGLKFEISDLYSNPTFQDQILFCDQFYNAKDELNDILDAFESDDISSEEALSLLLNKH